MEEFQNEVSNLFHLMYTKSMLQSQQAFWPRQETQDYTSHLFQDCDPGLLEKFKFYHEENPDLYDLMEKFALEAGQSRTRFSIWMIANRVRWYTQVETTGKEFKVSNDYLALYARLIVVRNPHLEGLFLFKTMKKHRTAPRQ